jgi:hypothetical protein
MLLKKLDESSPSQAGGRKNTLPLEPDYIPIHRFVTIDALFSFLRGYPRRGYLPNDSAEQKIDEDALNATPGHRPPRNTTRRMMRYRTAECVLFQVAFRALPRRQKND